GGAGRGGGRKGQLSMGGAYCVRETELAGRCPLWRQDVALIGYGRPPFTRRALAGRITLPARGDVVDGIRRWIGRHGAPQSGYGEGRYDADSCHHREVRQRWEAVEF